MIEEAIKASVAGEDEEEINTSTPLMSVGNRPFDEKEGDKNKEEDFILFCLFVVCDRGPREGGNFCFKIIFFTNLRAFLAS